METEEGQSVCWPWKLRDHEVSGEQLACKLTILMVLFGSQAGVLVTHKTKGMGLEWRRGMGWDGRWERRAWRKG